MDIAVSLFPYFYVRRNVSNCYFVTFPVVCVWLSVVTFPV